MSWMESKSKSAAFVAAWVLAVGGCATALAVLAVPTPARGNDSDREDYRRAEVTELTEATPWVGTRGSAAIQAQREAFHEQYVAYKQEFLAGKITPDLLLEAERFVTQADRDCCAPGERAMAIQLSHLRNRKIVAMCRELFAAGKIVAADLSQAEGQLRLVEFMEKQDQGK